MTAQTRASRITVVHLVLSLEVGGLENGVVNLVNALDRRAFRSVVVCLRRAGRLAARLEPEAALHVLGVTGPPSPTSTWRLARILRAEEADVVRCLNAEALLHGAPAARLAGRPALVYQNGGRTRPERPLRLAVERLAARFADRVVAVSDELADELASVLRLPRERIATVPNGVDVERFDRPRPRAEVRAALGLPPWAPVIGTVGRLVPQKRQELLVEAAAQLRPTMPELRVLIAGEGPARGRLAEAAAAAGIADRILLLGERDDVPDLLAAMDLFVLASDWEGHSNVLLEAVAAGVPVVATDVEGVRTVVEDGVSGHLVPRGSAAAIARAAAAVLGSADRGRALAAAARTRLEAGFTLEAMARRHEALLREVATRARAGAVAPRLVGTRSAEGRR